MSMIGSDNDLVQILEFKAWICTRDWSAWSVGTMGEDDFAPAWEDENVCADLRAWRDAAVKDAAERADTDGFVRGMETAQALVEEHAVKHRRAGDEVAGDFLDDLANDIGAKLDERLSSTPAAPSGDSEKQEVAPALIPRPAPESLGEFVFELLEDRLCRAMAHEGERAGADAIHEALALVQSVMCGTADPAFIVEQVQEIRVRNRPAVAADIAEG